MEIERKYLVRQLPADLDDYPHVEIEQSYLCTSPTVRIRRIDNVYVLTVKEKAPSTSSAIHNREEEFSLDGNTYRALLAKCDGNVVRKTRYRVPLSNGLTAELDVFHGAHQGLILVEVEFPDTATADNYTPPAWFGEDVSRDPRYRNSFLSRG